MQDHIHKQQWESHMAYYDRALRSLLELLAGTVSLMEVDGLSEVVVSLGKAAREIEDAWAALVWEHGSSIVAAKTKERVSENEVETEAYVE